MNRANILLAPGTPAELEPLQVLFEWRDLKVEQTRGRDSLFSRVRALHPDVVVVPVHPSRPECMQTVRDIRGLSDMEAIPILAVTPPLARKDRIALLSLGADDCIDLPFEPMELRAKVLALARRHGVRISIGMMRLELDKALADLHTYRADLKRLMDRIVEALEHLNLANDTDTGNHIHRVSEYARLLAETQGCPKNFVEQIHQYAGLHDVGKVGIRDAILKKPGAFTPQEWAEMKTHTLVGSRILERAGFSRTACNIAAYHHERWDGDGYPEGRKGVHIPLEARIVAVADSYDAGRNKRCYKDASGHEALRQDMLAKTGTQYDPELVEVFFSREEEILEVFASYAEVVETA